MNSNDTKNTPAAQSTAEPVLPGFNNFLAGNMNPATMQAVTRATPCA